MKTAVVGALAVAVVALAAAAGWAVLRGRDAPAAVTLTEAVAPASAAASGAAVSVTTVRAQRRDVDVVLDATGTVTALNSVDVRPQVSSTITKVHVREGQYVKEGQLLFSLDARSDEVNLAKAKAQLAKDQAQQADLERQLARSKDLFAQNFISQGAVDTAQAAVDAQQAVIVADRAAIDAAQVQLSYDRIASPTAGRAGAINVYPGTLVSPTGSVLVTITQLDPISVAFALPQRNLADALQALKGGGGKVLAILPESRGTLVGKLQFVDNVVDANSGTVRVKAEFANRDERLWPGAFILVRLAVQTLKDAVVLPQAAIIQSPRGKIVYVVGEGNRAAARPVEVVHAFGEDAAVSGVKAGERVVVEGRQNLRTGSGVIERASADAGAGARRSAAPASGPASGSGPPRSPSAASGPSIATSAMPMARAGAA
jgi:RND family efflux transporter MFP subunit